MNVTISHIGRPTIASFALMNGPTMKGLTAGQNIAPFIGNYGRTTTKSTRTYRIRATEISSTGGRSKAVTAAFC